jgi:WD40 repeat protein
MPDSRTLISGSFDKTVKFWDAEPAQAISSVQAHAQGCTAEFSPDGKTIASASLDGTLKFWDVARLAEPATLRAQLNPQHNPSFSINGRMLALGGQDRTIKLWDVASRKELATLTGHTDTVTDVRFLKKDFTLVSCSFDKTIRFWDWASFRQIASLDFGSAVEALALSADGQFLAAGGLDGSVSVFDASSRVKKFTLRAHDKECWALAFSPSGKSLATGAWDGTVKLWDLETKTAVVLRVPVVNVVAFSSDEKTLVTGSADKMTRFWNLATKQELLALEAHLTGVVSVQFSPPGDSLLTSGVDGKIKLWSAPTLKAIDVAESGQVVEKLK